MMNMRCINLTSHLVQGQGSRSDLHCITDNYGKAYALQELKQLTRWLTLAEDLKYQPSPRQLKGTDKTPRLRYWDAGSYI